MGNTSIQTQSYRAGDKDAGQSRSYIIPFALHLYLPHGNSAFVLM
ncbi:hypothetical protein PS030_53755, partial [Shigella sonnei]|nr:hypothetical protein [Shigella sonnei]